jgi:hypothetical protein
MNSYLRGLTPNVWVLIAYEMRYAKLGCCHDDGMPTL